MPDVPDHLLLSVLCHYKHLCRICWVSKVRILSSYATTSQRTTTRSSRAVNTEDCTLDIDYGKEISWSWEKPVILPCLRGRSVCVDAKRARRQKLYNRSLKGALENSNRLQNRDQSVNVIKKVKKKRAEKMHFMLHSCISCPAKWSYTVLESCMNPEGQQYMLHLSHIFSDLNCKYKMTIVAGFWE